MEKKPLEHVILPSGKVVPAIRRELNENEHTPEYLLEWLDRMGEKLPRRMAEFKRMLCTDHRMKEFWEWLASVRFTRLPTLRSSLSVSDAIQRATRTPGFPGNLTPAQRDTYFKKVRTHARALMELLRGTKFDREWMTEVSANTLRKTLADVLYSWGADEFDEGHTVAFQVTPEGRFEHQYDYPRNVLTATLFDVLEWTHWEDNWDGSWHGSSAPIAQANSARTPIIYFCCTLHDWFRGHGVEIPFSVLATVANVALDLPEANQVDEDSARKQVRRYQKRLADARTQNENAFDGATGQNPPVWDDSVLLDPF